MKSLRLTKTSITFIAIFLFSAPYCFATECKPDLKSISWKKNTITKSEFSGDCIMKFMDQLLPSNFEILYDGFGEYKLFDINNDGILELFVTTTSGRNFFNDLWIFISDNEHKRFLQHEHVWELDHLDSAFKDFEGDGISELIANIYLIGDGGLARPMAIWTAIFRWNGNKIERGDDLYKDFYLEKIPELESQLKVAQEDRSTLDLDDSGDKSIVETKQNYDHRIAVETILRDKILRTIDRDKRAGFQKALEWSHSNDEQMRIYSVFVFGDIFDKESRKQLEALMKDSNKIVVMYARNALENGLKGKNAD